MAIVKPIEHDTLNKLPEQDRVSIQLRMLNKMTDTELKVKDNVFRLLQSKIQAKDNVIDLKKMQAYCANNLRVGITEFQLRRIIISFEFEFTLWAYFNLINGDDEYFKKENEIRAQQISRWGQGQLQGKHVAR